MKRVVVTGIGSVTPIGNGLDEMHQSMLNNKSGIRYMQEWDEIVGLKSRVAGMVNDFSEEVIPRKFRRTMDRVAQMCAVSMEQAIADSGLDRSKITDPRIGISFGSAMGGLETLYEFASKVNKNNGFINMPATSFLKFMSHTVSANLAVMYNIIGKNNPTCSACSASAQAIGVGFEEIKSGNSDVMFCGGGEGLHFVQAGVFDSMHATSQKYNDRPEEASRPFDVDRNGLVVAEGAGTLVLESLEYAQKRGARIYAELVNYATNCDGTHITLPTQGGMKSVMEKALHGTDIKHIDYINAHATGTDKGDESESSAIHDIFKDTTPVSSLKGYTGHMFGGAGVVESIVALMALEKNFLPANKNLTKAGESCAPLDYLYTHREKEITTVMNNNFAFGGINTSLIFQKI